MKSFAAKYAALLGCVVFLFGNFVACGAQLYKVSMTDDHKEAQVPPESKDPTSATFGLHSPSGWRQLPIHFMVGNRISNEQRIGLVRAMNTWETAVGKKLFAFDGVQENLDGDDFASLDDSLPDLVNGDYINNEWAKTGKGNNVLATTVWNNEPSDATFIETADIRFNGNYYVIGDSLKDFATDGKEVVDMQTLALHELGHLLGLTHVSPDVDSYSIMTPSLYIGEGLSNRRLSKGDLERIQKIYGCIGASCNIDQTLALIDNASAKPYKPASSGETDSAH